MVRQPELRALNREPDCHEPGKENKGVIDEEMTAGKDLLATWKDRRRWEK